MHSRCSALPFLCAILPSRQRTLNLRRIAQRGEKMVAARVCVAFTRSLWSSGAGRPRWSLACLADVMHVFASARLWSLRSPLASSKSSSRNMVTACNNSRSRCSYRSSDSTKLLLAPQRIASLRQYVLQLLDGLQALLSNHHLVDWQDFPQYLRHPLQTLWP